jgi:hypothetical protein
MVLGPNPKRAKKEAGKKAEGAAPAEKPDDA